MGRCVTCHTHTRRWDYREETRGARTVPCFFNNSYLLVEINELNQLFLQDFLFADDLFDEHMLEQVEHVWSQLKVLNQTSMGRKKKRERAAGRANFLDLYSNALFVVHGRVNKQGSLRTHLQMKSLKLSDQSSGWWRVGGGFLLKEGMEKINGKIR